MNKKQWNTFGIGSWIMSLLFQFFSAYKKNLATSYVWDGNYVISSGYNITADILLGLSIIPFILGLIFIICGGFEK